MAQSDLVYLSGDSPAVLQTVDASHVYVLGGLVDHNSHKGLTQARAAARGVRTARLPIDANLLRTGSNLTLFHAFAALLRYVAQADGDWQRALRETVPQRKLAHNESGDGDS